MIAEEIQDEFETLHADIEEDLGNTNYLDNNEIVMRMKNQTRI
jgi:hypothetical protein